MIATALFYSEHTLIKTPSLRDRIVDGAESVTALALEAFRAMDAPRDIST